MKKTHSAESLFRTGTEEDLFENFWREYPNRASKAEALKSWKRLNVDDELFERIIASLAWQKHSEQWTKDGGRYVPHGSTFLNQRRFDDPPPENLRVAPEEPDAWARFKDQLLIEGMSRHHVYTLFNEAVVDVDGDTLTVRVPMADFVRRRHGDILDFAATACGVRVVLLDNA